MKTIDELADLYASGAIDEVLAELERGGDLYSEWPYRLVRARALYFAGHIPDAFAELRLALKLGASLEDTIFTSRLALCQLGFKVAFFFDAESDKDTVHELYMNLEQSVQAQDVARITELAKGLEVCSGIPEQTEVGFALAEWIQTQDEGCFERAVTASQSSGDTDAIHLMSRLEFDRGNWESCERLARLCSTQYKFNAAYYVSIMIALSMRGLNETALAEIECMPRVVSSSYQIQRTRAWILREMGDYVGAVEICRGLRRKCNFDRLVAGYLWSSLKSQRRFGPFWVVGLTASLRASLVLWKNSEMLEPNNVQLKRGRVSIAGMS